MHHERSLSPIPRSQDWACGPSAFLYGYCMYTEGLFVGLFFEKFCGDVVDCVFQRE